MLVSVNRDRCEGHGLCTGTAPGLFQLDENLELIALYEDTEMPADQEALTLDAVQVCPVAALTIHDRPG